MMTKSRAQQHATKALANRALYKMLADMEGAPYPDWQVTALFYAALHWVQAYFYENAAGQPATHAERNRGVAIDDWLGEIYGDYKMLYNLSREARYEVAPIKEATMQRAVTAYAAVFERSSARLRFETDADVPHAGRGA